MILWVGSYKHILPGNKNDRTMQKPLFFPGGRRSMAINAIRNNYITNLTSTYHGVKCRRHATLHQKGLKVTTQVD